MTRAAVGLVIFVILLARPGQAGQTGAPVVSSRSPTALSNLSFAFDGPPPPVPPEVISRDALGRATIRAVRIATPLQIDGRLDESIYAGTQPISDFVQNEPQAGLPATEKTELWVLFELDPIPWTV